MNEKHMSKTQLKLINTAGPLFAEDGIKGTRIRTITEAAGVNVAGINYHFGGKEKLYHAVVLYVFDRLGCIEISEYWAALPIEKRNKAGIYEMIRYSVTDMFTKFFKSKHPIWYFKIIQKELSNPSEVMQSMTDKFFEEDIKAVTEIFSIIKPTADTWDIEAWLVTWYAQVIGLSILIPTKVGKYGNNQELDERYIDATLKHAIISAISTLEQN